MARVARAAVVVGVIALAGCARGAKTPEDAYDQVARAVRAHDGQALFAALDQETQWAWMTVTRSHREAYDIVLSNFPEGERDRALRRFEAGALADGAAALFARAGADAVMADLAPALGAVTRWDRDGERATAIVTGGRALVFRHAKAWGYAGLDADAKELERRATADLEVVRNSATDYERARTRAGK